VRLALGTAFFVVALARGLSAGHALANMALGAAVAAFALLFDARVRSLDAAVARAQPLPDGARKETVGAAIWAALWPSTGGVTILALIALAFAAELVAVLAGVLFGMGLAGLAYGVYGLWWEARADVRLYVDRRARQVYAAPRESPAHG
jgi:hypothetical protein